MSRSGHIALFAGIPVVLLTILFSSTSTCAESHFYQSGHPEYLCYTNCDRMAKDNDEPGLATKNDCAGCHRNTEGVEPHSLAPRPPYRNAKFLHGSHAYTECEACHDDPTEGAPKTIEVNDCFKCHKEKGTERTCKDCHGQDRFIPSYHKPAGKWKTAHGLRANTMVQPDRGPRDLVKPGHVYDCDACHADDACRKCHQLNRPRNHTGFWRIRGHGITGLAQRESCANCHVETFCVRCHQETRPINHVGNWRLTHGRAGAGVHFERCSVCHPRIITRVQVGDLPECLFCHPR